MSAKEELLSYISNLTPEKEETLTMRHIIFRAIAAILTRADERQLKIILAYIRAMLGEG